MQLYVNAAPNDVGKLEDISKVEQDDSKLENSPEQIEDKLNTAETTRQKRYYNPYGFPPFNPLLYPNPNIRDFGLEDPLSQIHRRVQDIANTVRQPPPPPIPQVPFFFPILFVPPFDCRCDPINSQPTGPSVLNNNNTSPDVTNRFPEMEDERQNWGAVVNNTGISENDDQDYSRPISFDPIRLNRPNARPPPPVEHGTLQGDAADKQTPESGQNVPPPPRPSDSPSDTPPTGTQRPLNIPSPQPAPYPSNTFASGAPTACDSAILSCCHRPIVTYECFASQGCPNFTPYGNPCDSNLIFSIIEKFQLYYGNRT